MRRRDQLAIQLILWLALGTFLFGIWAIIVGFREQSPPPSKSGSATNLFPTTGSTN
jgi:hypothetical protein